MQIGIRKAVYEAVCKLVQCPLSEDIQSDVINLLLLLTEAMTNEKLRCPFMKEIRGVLAKHIQEITSLRSQIYKDS